MECGLFLPLLSAALSSYVETAHPHPGRKVPKVLE